jgi:hypothetical protein
MYCVNAVTIAGPDQEVIGTNSFLRQLNYAVTQFCEHLLMLLHAQASLQLASLLDSSVTSV